MVYYERNREKYSKQLGRVPIVAKKIVITGGSRLYRKSYGTGTSNEGYEVVVYDNLCNSSKESLKG